MDSGGLMVSISGSWRGSPGLFLGRGGYKFAFQLF